MAFSAINVVGENWTKLANNVTVVSIQVVSSSPVYITATAADAPPANSAISFVYKDTMTPVVKQPIASFSPSGGGYIWGRALSGSGRVIVDV